MRVNCCQKVVCVIVCLTGCIMAAVVPISKDMENSWQPLVKLPTEKLRVRELPLLEEIGRDLETLRHLNDGTSHEPLLTDTEGAALRDRRRRFRAKKLKRQPFQCLVNVVSCWK